MVRATKISTKKGDGGTTQVGTQRVGKDSALVEFLGSMDELQSCLGMAAYHCPLFKSKLLEISNILYEVMSYIHTKRGKRDWVGWVEKAIEEVDVEVPSAFLLPFGRSAHIHFCRAIARRCEREAVKANLKEELPFLNRLSDLLFIYAFICSVKNQEVVYSKPREKGS